MSIKLGIYDLFAYIIPGGFYVSIVLYILQRSHLIIVDYKNATTSEWIIFGVFAYIATFILSPIAGWFWHRLFRPKNLHEVTKKELKKRNPKLILPAEHMDSYIALAYIRHHNKDIADDIQQINSLHIMLRNLSFSFSIIFIILMFEFILAPSLYHYIIYALLALFSSIMCSIRAVVFSRWYYESIYQTVAGMSWKTSDLPISYDCASPKSIIIADSNIQVKPIFSKNDDQKL